MYPSPASVSVWAVPGSPWPFFCLCLAPNILISSFPLAPLKDSPSSPWKETFCQTPIRPLRVLPCRDQTPGFDVRRAREPLSWAGTSPTLGDVFAVSKLVLHEEPLTSRLSLRSIDDSLLLIGRPRTIKGQDCLTPSVGHLRSPLADLATRVLSCTHACCAESCLSSRSGWPHLESACSSIGHGTAAEALAHKLHPGLVSCLCFGSPALVVPGARVVQRLSPRPNRPRVPTWYRRITRADLSPQ